jgi:hypothetical protein
VLAVVLQQRPQYLLDEGAHGESGLALGPCVALRQDAVLPAFEEHVEPAVPLARLPRRFPGSRHPFDDLHGGPLGALREDGIAAEAAYGQEGALDSGRGERLSVEHGVALVGDEGQGQHDEEQARPQAASAHVRDSFLPENRLTIAIGVVDPIIID